MNQLISEHAELSVLMRNCLSLQNHKCSQESLKLEYMGKCYYCILFLWYLPDIFETSRDHYEIFLFLSMLYLTNDSRGKRI